MSDTIDWKARCEAAEVYNIKITREWSVQVTEMHKELEQTQKQFGVCSVCGYAAWKNKDATTEECQYCKVNRACAEMRDFFLYLKPQIEKDSIPEEIDSLEAVLSADAGRDYRHRDEFKPLRDACECWLIGVPSAYSFPAETSEFIAQCQARMRAALADARQKGLIE